MADRIVHWELIVGDLDKARQFYADVFGVDSVEQTSTRAVSAGGTPSRCGPSHATL